MTDAAIIERARESLGIRARVFAKPVDPARLRAARGIKPRAAYVGTDAQGFHLVEIAADLRGIARIYALAHECVHAAQTEALGGVPWFRSAYEAEEACARLHGADEREAYRRNRFERDALERGAEIAAMIAADLERDA